MKEAPPPHSHIISVCEEQVKILREKNREEKLFNFHGAGLQRVQRSKVTPCPHIGGGGGAPLCAECIHSCQRAVFTPNVTNREGPSPPCGPSLSQLRREKNAGGVHKF